MHKTLKLFLLVWTFVLPLLSYAQDKPTINATVTGTVVDASTKEPLIGATVFIAGITNGAVTDANGEFRLITGQKLPFTVVVSLIGYVKKEITISESKVEIQLEPDNSNLAGVVVTSRRRKEALQDIPIPVSVIRGATVEEQGAFNVNRLKELVPTVQFYASNARNTTLNIRGLGSTYGLTNDGIDPGVGYYVDGVYYARPAATALDFIDVDQVEVLRGPQGTLFGKNTTAGAFNVTSRAPSFSPSTIFELSYGNYGYIQAKASLSGPISKKLAARVSFVGTQRDGLLYNVRTQTNINDLNNIGFRAQLLYKPTDKISFTLIGDVSDQKPVGYGWPVAKVVTTKRAAYRQFDAIIADLNYRLPYNSAFERIVDHDTPSRAGNQLGGVSLNADIKIGNGTLTSTSAWRYWLWDPLNDRDYTGLSSFSISSGTSAHDQYSQEFRYSGKINSRISGVIGAFGLWQDLKTDPVHTEEAGTDQWRFAQNSTSPLWKTPGLLDNFGIRTTYDIQSASLALFAQADWAVTKHLHLLPGLRYNKDTKKVNYDRVRYGGLDTTDPALLALKNGVYTNQTFNVDAEEENWSGQLTLQYKFNENLNTFATYSLSYKPIGVNVGGLPTASGRVLTELATVKPEAVSHVEIGVKTKPSDNSFFNVVFHHTDIRDFQTQVQTPEPGVNRGYLANAEQVRVLGLEVDGSIRLNNHIAFNGAFAYTDGKYVKFTNAPVPIEEVGGAQAFKDISGGVLPGISKYAGSLGTEITFKGRLLGLEGNYIGGLDAYYRSTFSSSPSPSAFLDIEGYTLLNARFGFRASNGISLLVWSRNLTNKDYYEQLLVAPGSAGQIGGILGDPQTWGITLRYVL
jgi:iron complex outermembrane recepter protein